MALPAAAGWSIPGLKRETGGTRSGWSLASPGPDGEPVNQREVARNLRLPDGGIRRITNSGLQVGVQARIQLKACGDDAGSDVGAILDVQAAVDAEAARLAGPIQIQVSKALGSKRVAGHRFHKAKVQIAHGLTLPARMVKVVQGACDLQ